MTQTEGTWLRFNGTGSHIEVGLDSPLNAGTGSITVEFWTFVALAERDQQSYTFSFKQQKSGAGVTEGFEDQTIVRTSCHAPWNGYVYWDCGNIDDGGRVSTVLKADHFARWTHLAFVADRSAGEQRLFVDGEQAVTKPWNATGLNRTFDALLIGTDYSTGNYNDGLTGWIDAFRLWQVPRTAAQIKQAMNSRLGKAGGADLLVEYCLKANDVHNGQQNLIKQTYGAGDDPFSSGNEPWQIVNHASSGTGAWDGPHNGRLAGTNFRYGDFLSDKDAVTPHGKRVLAPQQGAPAADSLRLAWTPTSGA